MGVGLVLVLLSTHVERSGLPNSEFKKIFSNIYIRYDHSRKSLATPCPPRIVSSRSLACWRSLALPDCPDESLGLGEAVYSCQVNYYVHYVTKIVTVCVTNIVTVCVTVGVFVYVTFRVTKTVIITVTVNATVAQVFRTCCQSTAW